MRNYKARGHRTFAHNKNPFRIAKPSVSSHSGKRKSQSPLVKAGKHYRKYAGGKNRKAVNYHKQHHVKSNNSKLRKFNIKQKILAQSHYGSGGKQSFGKGSFLQPKSTMFSGRKFKSSKNLLFPKIYQKKYRSGAMAKKYRVKSGVIPKFHKNSYRTGNGGRKYRLRQRALAQSSFYSPYRTGSFGKKYVVKKGQVSKSGYRSGHTGKKYRVKDGKIPKSGYRSGHTGKKYRVKLGKVQRSNYRRGVTGKKYRVKYGKLPKSNYRTGRNARKRRLKQRALLQYKSKYRSGSFAKKYRVKTGKVPKSQYRSGNAPRKKYLKEKALRQGYLHTAYKASPRGKKYTMQSPVMLQRRYQGGGAKSKNKAFIPYQLSPSYGGNSRKKSASLVRVDTGASYRPKKHGQRYKVKSSRYAISGKSTRKHNATAVRVKKIAYLEKNSKRRNRKGPMEGGYHGHLTLNQILRLIILILTILVAVALGVLVHTFDQWYPNG